MRSACLPRHPAVAYLFLVRPSARRACVDDALNPEASRNDGVFRYHDDAVADKITFRIEVRRFAFRCNHDAIADARVLVDDRALDHTIAPDADRRSPRLSR